MFTYVAFKKLMPLPTETQRLNKELSSLSHILPIMVMQRHYPDKKALIVIDNMKHVEQRLVSNVLQVGMQTGEYSAHEVIFKDSKDKQFQLIQIADLLAGINRAFFETYESCKTFKAFWNSCPPCFNKSKASIFCRKIKRNFVQPQYKRFKLISHFYNRNIKGQKSIMTMPLGVLHNVGFVICNKK